MFPTIKNQPVLCILFLFLSLRFMLSFHVSLFFFFFGFKSIHRLKVLQTLKNSICKSYGRVLGVCAGVSGNESYLQE